MAATRRYFEDNTLNVQNGDTTDKVLIPTHLAEYGSTTEQIATKFKLDIVLPHHAGFLGGIKVSDSDNLAYHNTHNKNIADGSDNNKGDNTDNPNRLSKLRIYKDGTEYALFNDGGVNTKPDCWTPNFIMRDASPMLMWGGSNETRMKVAFQPARFCNTTSRKVEILNAEGTQVLATIELGTEVWDSDKTDHDIIVRISDYLNMNFVSGTKYILRVTATNSEGSIIDTYEDYCGIDVDFPYAFDYTTDTSGKYGDIAREDLTEKDSFYMFNRDRIRLPQLTLIDTDYDPPIMLYTDYFMNRCPADRSNIAPAGWYSDDGQNLYKVDGNGAIVSRGEVSNPQSKGFQIIPYITNNNTIGIEVLTEALTYPLTISTLSFYEDTSSTQSMGNAQPVNYTFTASTTNPINMGTRIDTGLTINIPVDENGNKAGAARFIFAESQYNNGVHNPIYQLISDDFIDKQ